MENVSLLTKILLGPDILSRIEMSNSFQGILDNRDRNSSSLGIFSSVAV
jgi:hypothetical protein